MAEKKSKSAPKPASYEHADEKAPMRPEIGVQAQFKQKKPPATYRYDSSLAPELCWDESAARRQGEELIARMLSAKTLEEARQAAEELKALSKPFLNWCGKAEQAELTVPTLPLFVHERLSTEAIIHSLRRHRKAAKQESLFDLFHDPQHSVADQILKAYEYQDDWVNRLILGDSLIVMNSLLKYEGLGGKVQMIYMDPPYGVKFGSNFQPFIRKRDVKHGEDGDLTREPEMVKAYRDTWELGLHSYLSYLRDRLFLCRELLTMSGSIFVQISDENVHHVREIMDEVFGAENFLNQIAFTRGGAQTSDKKLPAISDYILWYSRDFNQVRSLPNLINDGGWAIRSQDLWIELKNGQRKRFNVNEEQPDGSRLFTHRSLESARDTGSKLNVFEIVFDGRKILPKRGWSTTPSGVERLRLANRLLLIGNSLRYVVYLDDFPFSTLTSNWTDTIESGFATERYYVVQTARMVVKRCVLMTTNPGDLVFDPTCGSGTTAYVAEQWGRRWISCDVSRVPLALARQRLLTANYDYYGLRDQARGPSGGFSYKRKQNKKGEEVGGIVPRVTLKSIANDEPPEVVVLVDRPEVDKSLVRVSGPFVVEAVIPTPVDLDADGVMDDVAEGTPEAEDYAGYIARMINVLRSSPVISLPQGQKLELRNIRPLAKSLSLHAEAVVGNGGGKEKPVAVVFGPQHASFSERMVQETMKEAGPRGFTHVYFFGFGIEPKARQLIRDYDKIMDIPATYIQATPDLMMGDLLKNMRSSQLFAVIGMPDVKLIKSTRQDTGGVQHYCVLVDGLDTFDPETMDVDELPGTELPAWFLDTDYDGKVFHVCQAFFPRTKAWDSLKRALKADFDDFVWQHLSSTRSDTFPAGESGQVAVKVIDDRGNELLVVKDIKDALDVGEGSTKDGGKQ